MPYQYADYAHRTKRLVSAGHELIESLENESVDRTVAIHNLQTAAQVSAASDVVMGFSAKPSEGSARGAEKINPADAISSVLLDLQAANVLLSAGIALNEHGRGADSSLLDRSLQEAENSGATVTLDLSSEAAVLKFAAEAGVKSSTVEAAKTAFRKNAQGVLTDIVDDANAVVNDLLEKLKKFDGAKVIEGIDKLGESIQVVAAAGNLIRQGLDLLKKALDALSKLFTKEALATSKKKVGEIWEKFQSGKYTHDVLAWTFNVKGTEARIAAALEQANIDTSVIDNATNALPALSTKYKSNMKLLRSLMSAVALAGSIIAFLQVAAPWIPLAMAGVYAALIGATVLVGMDYSDSGHVLGWVRGVGQIASDIKSVG